MRLLIYFIILNISVLVPCQHNNVCKSLDDYKTIETNPRCYYNFAADKTTPEIVVLSGYPIEIHEIHTADGYTLILHRIPKQETHDEDSQRAPVLLQHGIFSASNFFVVKGNESLAFMLASDGYDVWMANFRGNFYSYKHKNLTVNDKAFWDYTLDDLSLRDFPQILKYIEKVTQVTGGIIYIGHSLGCTLPLMFASEFPEEAKVLLKFIILMAPAYSLKHTKSLVSSAARFSNIIRGFLKKHNMIQLLTNGHYGSQVAKGICHKKNMELCFRLFNLIMSTKNTVTPEIFPIVLNVAPKGGSLNLAIQIAGTISKPLSKFDYGKKKNLLKYGRTTPPKYNMEKIEIPIHIICAKSDKIVSYKDAMQLYNNLKPSSRSGFYMIPTKYFTHIDFGLGKYMKDLLNVHIIKYLAEKML